LPKLNPNIFREYDVRGLVGDDLNPATARLLGQAFGTMLIGHGVTSALVGRDNRASSAELAAAVTAGLRSTGVDVVDIGMVITPIFYYARIRYRIDGGVMVTGSHNPAEYNGFKLARGPATIYGREIQELRAVAEAGQFAAGDGSYRQEDPVPDYYREIWERVTLGRRHLKIVVDAGNGTAGAFAPVLLEGLGVEVVCLYCESDPSFPHHHPDPVKPANLRDLIAKVKETQADVGIAYDGDADRIGAVDDQGGIIWGDVLMALYWREILPRHPGTTCIVEVKCSQALVDEVLRLGGRPMFYRTGHSLIKAKMKEIGAVFTGEMSGHMFFADEYFGYDDALYATARLLRILSNTGERLSELVRSVPQYYSTPEVRVDCADDEKFRVVAEVARHFRSRYPTVDVDGVRVLFSGGWGLVRASNTQPALVVRCEGTSTAALEAIKAEVAGVLSADPAVGHIDWS
jgi:phosphomannomutase/phosphoglucomutase